mmetsp:Transcript_88749/g.286782  ORF Transcript_88749/g.286782 Transcript_88749/m.286782 type:complete len:184 (+) Transcript_88749:84-635(+)
MGGDHHELEEGSALKLDWEKLGKVAGTNSSVVPAAVQDARTGTLLILGYANETALNASFERGVCCLWSTSRNKLWIKGETSGDFLDLVEVRVNCEQNSLLYLVKPRETGACHTKNSNGATRPGCYYRRLVASPGRSISLEHCCSASPSSLGRAAWELRRAVAAAALLAVGAALGAAMATRRRP